jgi:transposase
VGGHGRVAVGVDEPGLAAGDLQGVLVEEVTAHVNRIKMLKRQMFGRAKPDLLRKRVLLAN